MNFSSPRHSALMSAVETRVTGWGTGREGCGLSQGGLLGGDDLKARDCPVKGQPCGYRDEDCSEQEGRADRKALPQESVGCVRGAAKTPVAPAQ